MAVAVNPVRAHAESLLALLSPACERIEIAGSLRRGSQTPRDIEIVAIPRIETGAETDMFGAESNWITLDLLARRVLDIVEGESEWIFDLILPRNGPNYKRLRHGEVVNADGVPLCCDLFITDARRWGAILAIRTGPGEFSKMLVARALAQGMFVDGGLLHHHPRQFRDWKGLACPKGEACPLIIPTPEEVDFFATLGLDWLPPEKRE